MLTGRQRARGPVGELSMSSKRMSRIPLFSLIGAVVLQAWLGCSSPAPSSEASPPSDAESAKQPALGASATPGSGSPADPSAAAPEPAGQASAARDGVEEPTAVRSPPTAPSSSNGSQADPATPPAPEPARADPAAPGDLPAMEPTPPGTTFPVSLGKPTIYLAGDSTVQTYSAAQAPQQGWGQRIQEFFTADVTFVNKAIGGRSSKSFIDEGRLDEIVALIQPGDYLFAQWGINDRYRSDPARFTDPGTTFKQYLNMYIDAARSKNAIPVLVTPTPRLDFSNGAFQNGFVEYCAAIEQVGADTDTRVIDLQTKGLAYYTSIGLDAVVANVSLPPMDLLHFQANGAFQMARLVAEGIKESDLPIASFVK
jgi:lysophospholipase L1-like esterase